MPDNLWCMGYVVKLITWLRVARDKNKISVLAMTCGSHREGSSRILCGILVASFRIPNRSFVNSSATLQIGTRLFRGHGFCHRQVRMKMDVERLKFSTNPWNKSCWDCRTLNRGVIRKPWNCTAVHCKRRERNTAMSVIVSVLHSAVGLCITVTQKRGDSFLLAVLDTRQW